MLHNIVNVVNVTELYTWNDYYGNFYNIVLQ